MRYSPNVQRIVNLSDKDREAHGIIGVIGELMHYGDIGIARVCACSAAGLVHIQAGRGTRCDSSEEVHCNLQPTGRRRTSLDKSANFCEFGYQISCTTAP